MAEDYDVFGKRLLDHFPQAISHAGLINTVRTLTWPGRPSADRQHPGGPAIC